MWNGLGGLGGSCWFIIVCGWDLLSWDWDLFRHGVAMVVLYFLVWGLALLGQHHIIICGWDAAVCGWGAGAA